MTIIKIFLAIFVIATAGFSCVRRKLNLKVEKAIKEAEDKAAEDKAAESKGTRVYGFAYDKDKKIAEIKQNYEEAKNLLRKVQRTIYLVLLGVVIISLLFGSIYFTNEQEIGFTSTFGVNTTIDGPGIHFKIPFLSQKHIYDATTQGMPIGYVEESNESINGESMMITSDFNFIKIDFYIEYRITDAIEYCYGCDDPKAVFCNIAQASIRNTVGMYDVDSVMTTGKAEIEMNIFDDIVQELDKHKTGLVAVNVTIQDVEAPTNNVANAFMDVSDAKSNADTYLNEANAYKNTQIPAAEANAEQIEQEATAAKTERINAAKEEVARFQALYTEYSNNPETVRRRMYYEAIQDILPNMEIIIGKDTKVIYVNDKSNETSEITTEKNNQQ